MDKKQKEIFKKIVAFIASLITFVSFFLLDIPSIIEKYFSHLSDKENVKEVDLRQPDENENKKGDEDKELSKGYDTQNQENILDGIIKQAEDVFNNEGYESAILVLKDAVKKYPNNDRLQQELNKYEDYRPIPITKFPQLENTAKGGKSGTLIDEYKEDKFNNKYLYSFSLSKGKVSYFLDGKFSLIKGVIACPKEVSYSNFRISATITISIDGNKKYISNPVEVDTYLQNVEIDLTGANKIEIEWECKGINISENWGYYATLFDTYFYK